MYEQGILEKMVPFYICLFTYLVWIIGYSIFFKLYIFILIIKTCSVRACTSCHPPKGQFKAGKERKVKEVQRKEFKILYVFMYMIGCKCNGIYSAICTLSSPQESAVFFFLNYTFRQGRKQRMTKNQRTSQNQKKEDQSDRQTDKQTQFKNKEQWQIISRKVSV